MEDLRKEPVRLERSATPYEAPDAAAEASLP
jgi:hypothetical protein